MNCRSKFLIGAAVLLLAAACNRADAPVSPATISDVSDGRVLSPVKQDVSSPFRLMARAPLPPPDGDHDEEDAREAKEVGAIPQPNRSSHADADDVVQSHTVTSAIPAPVQSFEGIGEGFAGPAGTFKVRFVPPDTNGDVGPNHYVQVANAAITVLSKTGTPLLGPSPINSLFSGFGGACEDDDDGDPLVQYDALADRWIVSQFAVANGPPYYQCIAVSTTPDPTGTYNRYAYSFSSLNDYPKIGVWPDAYYITYNLFGSSFEGGEVCAYDRAKMIAGGAATAQCFSAGASYGGLLPADLDGKTPPPPGSPNYVVNLGDNNDLNFWRVHIDWTNPQGSSLTGPTSIPVAPYTALSSQVSQPGSSTQLDTLADRLMYRFAYRNYGDHESLAVNHSVDAGGKAGVRWYELRNPRTTPIVHQQGTYSPSSESRWMGSVAMDASGNMGMAYSVASAATYGSIRFTGRLTSDSPGTMGQGEGVLVAGGGAQTGASRYGDYSAMTVDPTDDCTFWYTTEYLKSTGTRNWHTRIGAFRFPSCGPPPANDFSLTISPFSRTMAAGEAASFVVTTAVTNGSTQTVTFAVSGLPAGVTGSFAPAQVAAGGSTTLTVQAAADAAPSTSSFTITGTGPSSTRVVSGSATVSSGDFANGDFELGTWDGWITTGYTKLRTLTPHAGTYCARVGSINGEAGDSTIQHAIHVPATGTTKLSFFYQAHCTDTIQYDQQRADIKSTAGTPLLSIFNVCANSTTWTPVTTDLTAYAGQDVLLVFTDHDDGNPADATYFIVDDVRTTHTTSP